MARIGVLYDKDIKERVFGVFSTIDYGGRYIISITPSPSTISVGESSVVTATLTYNGQRISGQEVTFKIGGTTVGTGTTDNNGQVTYTYQSSTSGVISIYAYCNNVKSVTSIIVES